MPDANPPVSIARIRNFRAIAATVVGYITLSWMDLESLERAVAGDLESRDAALDESHHQVEALVEALERADRLAATVDHHISCAHDQFGLLASGIAAYRLPAGDDE